MHQADAKEVQVPFNQRSTMDGDVTSWERPCTGFMRAFIEAILGEPRSENPSRQAILEWIYQRIEQRLQTDPERHVFHDISIGALLKRRCVGSFRAR
ncbi:MAG: hypothetical protein WBN80_06625 [Prochlorococcaceae cyanobacterium]